MGKKAKIGCMLNHLILLKKIQKRIFFSQTKPIAVLSHMLAGVLAESFSISEVPFVSQLAFECRTAKPRKRIKSKMGFELLSPTTNKTKRIQNLGKSREIS